MKPTAVLKTNPKVACALNQDLSERPVLSHEQASELECLFKVLANDTRLRILHVLARSGEVRVSALCCALGMKPQAVSNQLQRLSDRGIVSSRREGNSVHYWIADPCIPLLLGYGICLAEDSKERRKSGEAIALTDGNGDIACK
ncbi:MAG: metalloregulator ArsR/SmtB family transcription factor [Desulfosarcina sp.]